MGFEAIVLAGGLGTRMRSVVADLPKVMIDIAGRPFLEILLGRMMQRGLRRAILATGHLHPAIESHFGSRFENVEIAYSLEPQPLGTGGAIWKALEAASQDDVFVFNGDTFFDIDLGDFCWFHQSAGADASMALKPMRNFERYGTVKVENQRITGFREKQPSKEGWINGGIYLLNRRRLGNLAMPERFSIETDFFEKHTSRLYIGGYVADSYFIDIGVPEDYARAQTELTME